MKALRFHAAKDLRVEEIDLPLQPRAGEVLLKVSKCGICGSDLHEFLKGPVSVPVKPHPVSGAAVPQILGHEFSAVVAAVGPGVVSISTGDRVAVIPHINQPNDYFVRRHLGHISPATVIVGMSYPWGGMGEFVLVPEQNVVRLPATMTDEQGALVEPTSVALHAVDVGGVAPGSSVLITGAGPIGVLAAMCAVAAGATKVLVFEPNPARRLHLATLDGVHGGSETVAELLQAAGERLDGGQGVDVAIECSGHEAGLSLCIDAAKRGGTLVQVGLFVGQPHIDMYKLCEKALTLRGSWGFPITIGPRVVELISAGKIPVERVISGVVGLDEAVQKGFVELTQPGSDKLKILIDMGAASAPVAGR